MKKPYKHRKLKTVELHPIQLSTESFEFLKECRDYKNTDKTLPDDVYEEGRGYIILIRMMRQPCFKRTDKRFKDMPESLKQLLEFMRDNKIEIVYCDTECGGIEENPKEMTQEEFRGRFINDPRLPLYIGEDDDEKAVSYDEIYATLTK